MAADQVTFWQNYLAVSSQDCQNILSKLEAASQNSVQQLRGIAAKSTGSSQDLLSLQKEFASFKNLVAKIEFCYLTHQTDVMSDLMGKVDKVNLQFDHQIFSDKTIYGLYKMLATSISDAVALTSINKMIEAYHSQGINLSDADQEQAVKLSTQLANLHRTIEKNISRDSLAKKFYVSAEQVREVPGWVDGSSEKVEVNVAMVNKILTYSSDRALREQAYRLKKSLATSGSTFDNTELIKEALCVSADLARLHGYNNYADFINARDIFKSSTQVKNFLYSYLSEVKPKAIKELNELQQLSTEKLQPWDISFYEQQKKAIPSSYEQNFPYKQVKLGLSSLLEDIFDVEVRSNFNSDNKVEIFSVISKQTGAVSGYLLIDAFFRAGKAPGAMMLPYHIPEGTGNLPCAAIICNFLSRDQMSIEDLNTLLHETGHALHHIFSEVPYYNLYGTNVKPSFVEVPSQAFEKFLNYAPLLEKFAIPNTSKALLSALSNYHGKTSDLSAYGQTILSILDQTIYSAPDKPYQELCKQLLTETSLLPSSQIEGCIVNSFHHMFSDYAAGYYTYLSAKKIADTMFVQWFDLQNLLSSGRKIRQELLSLGDIVKITY